MLSRLLESSADALEFSSRIIWHLGECGYRGGTLVIPVAVKHIGHVVDDRPNAHDIQVTKFCVFPRTKILVCNIAATNNRDLIVDRK